MKSLRGSEAEGIAFPLDVVHQYVKVEVDDKESDAIKSPNGLGEVIPDRVILRLPSPV